MVNVMIGRKFHITDSRFLQLIIHISNLLARISLVHCFLYVSFKSEFTVFPRVPNLKDLGFFLKLINGWVLINKWS